MYQVKNVGTSPPALWENWALVPWDDVIVTVHMSMRIFLQFADCWFQFFSFCTLLGKMFPPDFQLCFHELKQLKQLQPCISIVPRLEFPIYILIQWFKHRNSIAQLKKIDGDRWPCLLYRLFTSYVAAFTRNSGFWSIPIPSVRSIMYGRLSCLYISPKKNRDAESAVLNMTFVGPHDFCMFLQFWDNMKHVFPWLSWLILPGPNG